MTTLHSISSCGICLGALIPWHPYVSIPPLHHYLVANLIIKQLHIPCTKREKEKEKLLFCPPPLPGDTTPIILPPPCLCRLQQKIPHANHHPKQPLVIHLSLHDLNKAPTTKMRQRGVGGVKQKRKMILMRENIVICNIGEKDGGRSWKWVGEERVRFEER